jgi:membrane-bound lytic murein transglycosylase B
MFFLRLLLGLMGLTLALTMMAIPVSAHSRESFASRFLKEPKYIALLNELRQEHGFHKGDLEKLFRQAQLHPEILKRYEQPKERLPYHQYRQLFIKPEVITAGQQYLQQHRELFMAVEQVYGVDSSIIAAILGVETKFGSQPDAKLRVFDVLNTAFAVIPQRESFARKELIEFLRLCREEKLNPLSILGSYAGAMGVPQFIPSSYRHYAIDYDGDGKRDLWQSHGDIVASVANFLRQHGWEKGAPVRLPVAVDSNYSAVQELIGQGLGEKTTVASLMSRGVAFANETTGPDKTQEVSLIAYPQENREHVVAIFANFRTLLRYNRSVNYALVVADMAEILASESR